MRSKLSHQGEVIIDHRNSPGISPEWMAEHGLDPDRAVGAGRTFVSGLKNCSHCGDDVIMHPQRQRERAWCRSCDAYICDGCGLLLKLGKSCKPLQQTLYEIFSSHQNLKEF